MFLLDACEEFLGFFQLGFGLGNDYFGGIVDVRFITQSCLQSHNHCFLGSFFRIQFFCVIGCSFFIDIEPGIQAGCGQIYTFPSPFSHLAKARQPLN
jgi:hypothetical protein